LPSPHNHLVIRKLLDYDDHLAVVIDIGVVGDQGRLLHVAVGDHQVGLVEARGADGHDDQRVGAHLLNIAAGLLRS